MRFKIGEIVREGGINGPLSRIIAYSKGVYTVVGLSGKSQGWISEDMLYKYKNYEQLELDLNYGNI